MIVPTIETHDQSLGPVLYCGQALRQLPQLPVLQASRIRASPLEDIFLHLFSVKVVVKSFLHGSKRTIVGKKRHLQSQKLLQCQCTAMVAARACQVSLLFASEMPVHARAVCQNLHQELGAVFLSAPVVEVENSSRDSRTATGSGIATVHNCTLRCRRGPQRSKPRQCQHGLKTGIDEAAVAHVAEFEAGSGHVRRETRWEGTA